MIKLSPKKRKQLEQLIRDGARINLMRWDIEREIELLVGAEYGEFVDLWGDLCVGMKTPNSELPKEGVEHGVSVILNHSK